MSVNLDALAASIRAQEDGTEVDILDPRSGEPVGLKITVAGIDSQRYRLAWRAELRATVAEGSLDTLTEKRDEEGRRRIAAACVIGWSPNPEIGGKGYQAGTDDVEELFTLLPFVFDQVWGRILDREGFTKR